MTRHWDEPLAVLADAVRDLTTPAMHAEPFTPQDQFGRPLPSRRHFTRHPSLLEQLRAAGTAGRGSSGDAPTGGYESRPAARLEALDRLTAIEQAVDDWLVRYFVQPPRDTLEDNLRAVLGLTTLAPDDVQQFLATESSRWLTWARVVTGWDSAPWRPNAACPMCETVGGLRVRLDAESATCLDCGEAWTPLTIGLLADHLRGLNADVESDRAHLARLQAAVDGYFPHRGPCLMCGVPGEDARHRVMDAIVELVVAGDPVDAVAETYALPVDAVLTLMQLVTWPTADTISAAVSA